jgi:hypothetical protein
LLCKTTVLKGKEKLVATMLATMTAGEETGLAD